MKKSVCMKGNDPFTHTDYRIGFFPHSCEGAKKSNSFERIVVISAEIWKTHFLFLERKQP